MTRRLVKHAAAISPAERADAAALGSIFSKSAAVSRAAIVALCVLAAWTLAVYSLQMLTFGQSRLSDWWREFVLIAVLPVLAVLHLAYINRRRYSLLAV